MRKHAGGYQGAYLINPRGDSKSIAFDFGHRTEVYQSCSLQWQNHFYVFGGYNTKENLRRQVSMVKSNRMERKATLDFDLRLGACAILNQLTIVLCFDYDEPNMCRQSNNPLGSFTKLPNSIFDHEWTSVASFDGENKFY